ncbi:MAG TPA: HAMP domain-containing sensor histidine kinase [Ktedonobacteraceae bacterium]|nr:HAMP domain-containing sensor histidine kinase [Ktedonobacteraceae bacterium]
MEVNDERSEKSLSAVLAALADFAQMAQHASDDSTAQALLERILLLCNAERGALLFVTGDRYMLQPLSAPTPITHTWHYRTVVRHALSQEEVSALLTNFGHDAGNEAIQIFDAAPEWMLWPHRVTIPAALLSSEHTTKKEMLPAPLQALFLIGWAGRDAYVPLYERGRQVLPLVAAAVGTVILHIYLAEHMCSMETVIDERVTRKMDLLKAELLATVSHELRSPLAAIKGYAGTLLRYGPRISREEQHEFLTAIDDASSRLEVVIDRLLEISQLETGTISLHYTQIDLMHLIREAIVAVEQRLGRTSSDEHGSANGKQMTFTLYIEEYYDQSAYNGLLIQADRRWLREVLDNLLENAIIYSPESRVVEVGVRTLAGPEQDPSQHVEPAAVSDRPLVEIWVRDHGIGIPSEHLEHIFDRFYRVDTRLTREANGLGLGLAICKRIVEMHDGMIWAESHAGEGSTFHVLLPIHECVSPLVHTLQGE